MRMKIETSSIQSLTAEFRSTYDPSMNFTFRGATRQSRLKTIVPFGLDCGRGTISFSPYWVVQKARFYHYPIYSPFEFDRMKIYGDEKSCVDLISDRYSFSMRISNVVLLYADKDEKIGRSTRVCEVGGVEKIGERFYMGKTSITLLQQNLKGALSTLYSQAYRCSPNQDDPMSLKDYCTSVGYDLNRGESDLERFRQKNEVRFMNRYSIRMYDPLTNGIRTFFSYSTLFS